MNIKESAYVLIVALVLIIIFAVGFTYLANQEKHVELDESIMILRNVNRFGEQIQKFSLEDSVGEATESIRDNFYSYVDERLIDLWIKNPGSAPGESVLEGIPDGVKLTDIVEMRDIYNIHGEIIMITNEGVDSKNKPFNLFIGKDQGKVVAFNDRKKEFERFGFSILFSGLFKKGESFEEKEDHFWSYFPEKEENLLLVLHFSDDYSENSNMNDAYITVGASTDPEALEMCDAGNLSLLNQSEFFYQIERKETSDAFFQVRSYMKEVGGTCLAIESLIESTYSDEYQEKESREFIEYLLSSVVNSIEFK